MDQRARDGALFGGVLLSRVPFLFEGYGVEPDGWRVAAAATRMLETLRYVPSRLGANPLHEILVAAVVRGGPACVNGLSAIATAFAAVLFARVAQRLRLPYAHWLGAAFAAVPAVYVAGTSAKDYALTTAFLLAALAAILEQRTATAGIAAGLATGCRLSVGPLIFPLALLAWADGDEDERPRRLLRLLVPYTCTTLIVFAPPLSTLGLDIIAHTWFERPPLGTALERLTLGTFGLVGTAALVGGASAAIVARIRGDLDSGLPRPVWIATALAATFLLGLYFAFPVAAGYLVPLVPFVLLALAAVLPRRAVLVFCLALLPSAFVGGWRPATEASHHPARDARSFELAWGGRRQWLEPWRGPILLDAAERRAYAKAATAALRDAAASPRSALYVAGWWLPYLEPRLGEIELPEGVRFVYLLEPADLEAVIGGAELVALPGSARLQKAVNGLDLLAHGARELRLDGR